MEVESGAKLGRYWSIWGGMMRHVEKGNAIRLRGRLKSLEILSHVNDAGSSGVGNAAAGAVLGFLLAGPVGTAIGAAAGRGSGKKMAKDEFRVRIVTTAGHNIVAKVLPNELVELQEMLEDANAATGDRSSTILEKIKVLESLYQNELISQEEYHKARMQIIGS